MTEEQNIVKEEKCNCICHTEGFRKFIVVAAGSFVGVFCALTLFAALHKPPMPLCPMNHPMMRPPMAYHHHFNKGHFDRFDKRQGQYKFDKKIQPKVKEDLD